MNWKRHVQVCGVVVMWLLAAAVAFWLVGPLGMFLVFIGFMFVDESE